MKITIVIALLFLTACGDMTPMQRKTCVAEINRLTTENYHLKIKTGESHP